MKNKTNKQKSRQPDAQPVIDHGNPHQCVMHMLLIDAVHAFLHPSYTSDITIGYHDAQTIRKVIRALAAIQGVGPDIRLTWEHNKPYEYE